MDGRHSPLVSLRHGVRLSTFVRPAVRLPGPYSAVIFDMDGLLVHTERQWLQAKVMLFERYGQRLTADDRAAVFGTSELRSATYFAGRFGLPPERIEDLRLEYRDIITGLIEAGVEVTPGATQLVERLSAEVPIGLASNTRRSLVDTVLRQTPFGSRFTAISTGDEAEPKPAPDIYALACRRLGVDPRDAIALEDSPTGVSAARAAGLTCIGVPSDPDEPLSEADHIVASLTELL
jgi:HAD superfamily hydrolase (TIGR01509 family)